MTFEEAKHRNDYRFRLNGIEDLIDDIRNNCMKGLYPENEPYLSEAVLEIGYMDVEVNIYAYCQCSEKAVPEDKRPAIDYFTCIKTGEDDESWDLREYLNYTVCVDWNANNWVEQLERDMFKALDKFVNKKGYSYDHANKIIIER